MALQIYLLGQFKLQVNYRLLELPSRPAQSLLAFLVLNAGVTHRRERLASLIWPDATETNARRYLRQAIWRVRKSMEGESIKWEDYLDISDIEIAFNDQSDYWLDADHILGTEEGKSIEDLIEIIRLYKGELLPGFYDEWIVPQRDRLHAAYHQKMNLLLSRLCESGLWKESLQWGEKWIQLGHSPEPAFRALMRSYAGLGDQTMVSATYQRCVDALDRELGLDPSLETRTLYERLIQEQVTEMPASRPILAHYGSQLPRFLDNGEPEMMEYAVFVAREYEIAKLEDYLSQALSGKGRVVFVIGEAGSGKTAMIDEFARRAQKNHPDLVVTSGNCNAHTGVGDPYLPFREILGLLTGDVEALWAAGVIAKEHARRLWNTFRFTAVALMESGPDLINTFIPGAPLISRGIAAAPDGAAWLDRLKEVVERKGSGPHSAGMHQVDLFEQYTRVLKALARSITLVLVLDDLQWADAGSIGLLFHLGRQLAGSQILILGAYRQEEVALGRQGERHPLDTVINEFQREFGDIFINLEQADRRRFVEYLLDSEPNQLGSSFRKMLYRQTRGHPLFTIELLRGMQDRGDLVRNEKGQWIEGLMLDWDTMPARVEAVFAERIARLSRQSQATLQVAAVEGEVFTAEVVARIMGTDKQELLSLLSGELDRKHRLIRAESIQRLSGRFQSSYRFRHFLFQKYLYNSLDEVERAHLHERVGISLEEEYTTQEQLPAVALKLARHFEKAGIPDKAIGYLHQIGERAIQLSAYLEGMEHLNRALELLHLLPESPKRDRQELKLRLSFGKALKYLGPRPQDEKAFYRTLELCKKMGKTTQLSRVLGDLSIYHYVRAEYQTALEFAREALSLAEKVDDPILEAECHWELGFIMFTIGDYLTAKKHINQVVSFYLPEQHHHMFVLSRGVDVGLSALAYDSCCLWCLGYSDQASQRSIETLELARTLDHPFSSADVLCFAGCLFNQMYHDARKLKENSETLINLVRERELLGWLGVATTFRGESLAMQGHLQEAITQIREGMEISVKNNEKLHKPHFLRTLAIAQVETGHPQTGMATLEEAQTLMRQLGEYHWEIEILLTQAAFLAKQGDNPGAETSYGEAIEVARRRWAKLMELRASTRLADLLKAQGKVDEARELLEPIYNWFTEGFNSPDLKEAKSLLQTLT